MRHCLPTEEPICAEAVLVAVVHGEQALIVREAKCSPYWKFPGGGVRPGESIRKAGKRELWEETGLTVSAELFRILDIRIIPTRRCLQHFLFATIGPKLLEPFAGKIIHRRDPRSRDQFEVRSISRGDFAQLVSQEEEFLRPQKVLARTILRPSFSWRQN